MARNRAIFSSVGRYLLDHFKDYASSKFIGEIIDIIEVARNGIVRWGGGPCYFFP